LIFVDGFANIAITVMAAKKSTTKKAATKKTTASSKTTAKKTSKKKTAGTTKKKTSREKSLLSAEAYYLEVQRAAYYIAEKSGWLRDPVDCWIEAEKQFGSQGSSRRR
jgi:hypothetical protein